MTENPCANCGQPRAALEATFSHCSWRPASSNEEKRVDDLSTEVQARTGPRQLLNTIRGIQLFLWGLNALATLLLLGVIFGLLLFAGPIALAAFRFVNWASPVLSVAAQLLMIIGITLVTAVPKQSGASVWACLTLILGLASTMFSLAKFQFQLPMQWGIGGWLIVFVQATFMAKCLAVISRWIHGQTLGELVEGQPSRSLREAAVDWSYLQDQFQSLLQLAVTVFAVCVAVTCGFVFFGSAILGATGLSFFFALSLMCSLIAMILSVTLLVRFSRNTSKMLSSLRLLPAFDSQGREIWAQVPEDKLRPAGVILGCLAVASIGGDWYAANVMAPKYAQRMIADLRGGNSNASIGNPAPEMSLRTIGDETFSLSEMRGKVVVLNFWATWCGPCVKEIPDLQRLASEEEDGGLIVIGISNEPVGTLKRFAAQKKINYPIVSGKGWDPPFDKIAAIPTTFVLDDEGTIRDVLVGAQSYDTFKKSIDKLARVEPTR